jgi:hypothetical protein
MNSNVGDAPLAPILIKRVALGIRFQPQFRVADVFGELVDRILRSSGSPFGPGAFPLVRSNPTERVLVNEKTGESLHLNIRDAILEMDVETKEYSEIEALAGHYNTFVLEPLRNLADIDGIERYGMLLKLEECRDKLGEMPVKRYLGNDFDDARSLQLRFTRRLPSLEARVRKNVDDFRNAIYILDQDEDASIHISIDYQEYFRPALDRANWQTKTYPKFVTRGMNYFQGEFTAWLRSLQQEPALIE